MKKIGIYAGTFDPIHDGHIAFAQAALAAGLEKVMFLVEPRPRRKQGVRALEHRLAMVQLAIQDQPKMSSIILEQARFTAHETIPLRQNRFKGYQLVLLFGDDVIAHIAHHIADWPHIDELAASVELMVAARRDDEEALKETFTIIKKTSGLSFAYTFVEPSYPDVSSSRIRLELKKRQQPTHITESVWRYIRSHRLYTSFASGSK
jgi:nicotinate-nucleotide adenylyltransferase